MNFGELNDELGKKLHEYFNIRYQKSTFFKLTLIQQNNYHCINNFLPLYNQIYV